jgi:hypothetical protein
LEASACALGSLKIIPQNQEMSWHQQNSLQFRVGLRVADER